MAVRIGHRTLRRWPASEFGNTSVSTIPTPAEIATPVTSAITERFHEPGARRAGNSGRIRHSTTIITKAIATETTNTTSSARLSTRTSGNARTSHARSTVTKAATTSHPTWKPTSTNHSAARLRTASALPTTKSSAAVNTLPATGMLKTPNTVLPMCAAVDDIGVSTIATRHHTAARRINRGSHAATVGPQAGTPRTSPPDTVTPPSWPARGATTRAGAPTVRPVKFGYLSMNPAAGIHPATLAVELEQRGFDSLWVPEHSHIPASRRTSY